MIVGSRRKQRGALRTHDSAGEAPPRAPVLVQRSLVCVAHLSLRYLFIYYPTTAIVGRKKTNRGTEGRPDCNSFGPACATPGDLRGTLASLRTLPGLAMVLPYLRPYHQLGKLVGYVVRAKTMAKTARLRRHVRARRQAPPPPRPPARSGRGEHPLVLASSQVPAHRAQADPPVCARRV